MPKRHSPGASATRVLRHIEEIVLATSGEDAFELVFAIAASRIAGEGGTRKAIARVAKKHPELGVEVPRDATDELVARVDALVAHALGPGDPRDGKLEALDAVFESLVPRLAKGDKGQFFTPRHVVDFVVRALAPRAREVVVDPACGSGAFLAHARAFAPVRAFGCDVDPRAVRVARLLALSQGRDPDTIARADGLRHSGVPLAGAPLANIVATNPPFAGSAPAEGFEVADVVRRPERDVLFLERALDLLRPGGRLGIVLPYNKAAGGAYAPLRKWLLGRARVFAIVGLPRETFLPHTAQRTFVLFAKKRAARAAADPRERAMFVVSERAGKDSAGEPIVRSDGLGLDHDLDDVARELGSFLSTEGFAA